MKTLKELEYEEQKLIKGLETIRTNKVKAKELEEKRDTVKAEAKRRLSEAEKSVRAYVKAEGFNFAELMGTQNPSSKTKGASKPAKDKYRHPEDRRIAKHKGPKPQWVNDYISRGEEQLILIPGWDD